MKFRFQSGHLNKEISLIRPSIVIFMKVFLLLFYIYEGYVFYFLTYFLLVLWNFSFLFVLGLKDICVASLYCTLEDYNASYSARRWFTCVINTMN